MSAPKHVRMWCRRCRKLVNIYECYREEKVLPELKPEFDVVTWCCIICNTPIIEVSELHGRDNKKLETHQEASYR